MGVVSLEAGKTDQGGVKSDLKTAKHRPHVSVFQQPAKADGLAALRTLLHGYGSSVEAPQEALFSRSPAPSINLPTAHANYILGLTSHQRRQKAGIFVRSLFG